MSDTENTMIPKPGRFSWNELVSTNPQASAEFYGKLFGWQATPFAPAGTPPGGPPYLVFKTDPATNDMGVGGLMQAPAPGIPTHWLAYVIVEDADAALAKAVTLGARACMPVMAIPDVGRITVIQDPLGAMIGLHEPPK